MAPQSDPEAMQMDMGRPFETYGIYCLGSKVGHKEWHRKLNFSLLALLGVFFLLVLHRFSRFRCQKGVQNGLHFRGHGDPKNDKIRKRHLVPPKTANFLPIGYFLGYRDTQMTPKAASTASRKQLPENR